MSVFVALLAATTAAVTQAAVFETVTIADDRAGGGGSAAAPMRAGVYRPDGDGPFPVVVYSHGRSGTAQERSQTRVPDPRGHVRYWLAHGFAVVAPVRPGYGETGGVDDEDSGVRYDLFGNCWGRPDFAHSADVAADAVLATVAWLRTQPWADASRVVLAGVSMGGFASVAAAARNPAGVVGYVNFSGGTGGSGTRAAEHDCGLDEMPAVMAAYGKRTRIPGLWLYASNDSFWGAERPRAWFDAYANPSSTFVMTAPVPRADGHQLLTRGSALWAAQVDGFLAGLGL